MNFPVIHSRGETGAVLGEALKRRTILVVSYRCAGGWRTFKSRMVSLDRDSARVCVELPCGAEADGAEHLHEGQYVGVTFRRGHKKCLCTCVVAGFTPLESASEHPQGVVLGWPKEIQVLQRRAYYRAAVPPNMPIKALIWAGTCEEKPENPGQDRSSLYAGMVDISLGGMAVRVPEHEECSLAEGQTVSCEFTIPDGAQVMVEAHFRHITHKPGGELLLGFQFVGLEHGREGRQRIEQLTALMHQLTHRGRSSFRGPLPRRRQSV